MIRIFIDLLFWLRGQLETSHAHNVARRHERWGVIQNNTSKTERITTDVQCGCSHRRADSTRVGPTIV